MLRSTRAPYVLGAAVCFAVFLLLAVSVGRGPDPAWLLTIEHTWVNHGTLVAWWFTNLGYWYVLVPLCLIAIGVAIAKPAWRWPVALTIVALLLSWQGADAWQHLFGRVRRLDWVWKHETAFSFPSSHAAIAAGFYGFWAWLLARTATRAASVSSVVLTLAAIGIVWSRLALGAHYLTDVLGGILWGATVVLTLIALASPIKVLGRRSQRG